MSGLKDVVSAETEALAEVKALKDFTKDTDEVIERVVEPNKRNPAGLDDAVEQLLVLEKKCRMSNDTKNSIRVCESILSLCLSNKAWPTLKENITLLAKRRAQAKQVVTAVIKQAFSFVHLATDEKVKMDFVETLIELSSGKVHVELECARLTQMLSQMKEKEGDKQKASDLLQGVQIEILGSMELSEKADFLLEQFRLTLETEDYVRAELTMNKIVISKLQSKQLQDKKLRYYNLLIHYHLHNDDFLETCKAYRAIFDTPKIQEDKAKWMKALQSAVIFLVLATHSNEQHDYLHRLKSLKQLTELPDEKLAIQLFTTHELIPWPLPMELHWKHQEIFSSEDPHKDDQAKSRWKRLHKMVTQHNIRVIARYYSRISMPRLANLLQLTQDEAESHVSEMVQAKMLWGRMNRPEGKATFDHGRMRDASQVLSEWRSDVNELLTKIEHTCHCELGGSLPPVLR